MTENNLNIEFYSQLKNIKNSKVKHLLKDWLIDQKGERALKFQKNHHLLPKEEEELKITLALLLSEDRQFKKIDYKLVDNLAHKKDYKNLSKLFKPLMEKYNISFDEFKKILKNFDPKRGVYIAWYFKRLAQLRGLSQKSKHINTEFALNQYGIDPFYSETGIDWNNKPVPFSYDSKQIYKGFEFKKGKKIFYSVSKAAKELGITAQGLRKREKSGKIHPKYSKMPTKFGLHKMRLYNRDEILNLRNLINNPKVNHNDNKKHNYSDAIATKKIFRVMIIKLIPILSRRELLVMILRSRDYTQKKISSVMKINQSTISRIEKNIYKYIWKNTNRLLNFNKTKLELMSFFKNYSFMGIAEMRPDEEATLEYFLIYSGLMNDYASIFNTTKRKNDYDKLV